MRNSFTKSNQKKQFPSNDGAAVNKNMINYVKFSPSAHTTHSPKAVSFLATCEALQLARDSSELLLPSLQEIVSSPIRHGLLDEWA
jgi:hypothetical protein